jgi:hypothetical protein
MPSERVLQRVAELRLLRDRLLNLGMRSAKAADGNQYLLDLVTLGATNRALHQLRAFCDAVESENFVAAAPFVRMQLDTYLRLLGAGHAANLDEFVDAILSGVPLKKIRMRNGKRMTDAALISLAAKDDPWVNDVYTQTSGFIHLSEKHIWSSMRIDEARRTGDGNLPLNFKISDRDEYVPDDAYWEAMDRFKNVTDLLCKLLEEWIGIKDEAWKRSVQP